MGGGVHDILWYQRRAMDNEGFDRRLVYLALLVPTQCFRTALSESLWDNNGPPVLVGEPPKERVHAPGVRAR